MRNAPPTATARESADAAGRPASQPDVPSRAGRAPYERPRVERLGHWQVHTLETFSVPVLP